MRRIAVLMIAMAALLLALRCWTGIYYRTDSALAYLVVKPTPTWAIEQDRVTNAVFDRAVVFDEDEADLAYGPLYRGLMRAVPVLAIALCAVAIALWRRDITRR